MKRYLALLLCLMLVLTGCGTKNNTAGTIPEPIPQTLPASNGDLTQELPSTDPTDSAACELIAVSLPASTESFSLEDNTELFFYTAQHMQLIHPNEEIADKVILDFLNRVDAARTDAEATLAAAQNDYQAEIDWYPYFYQLLFSPTRIDPGVLSLYGTCNSYSGAMHGSVNCVSANYDLTTGDVLTLGSIMHMDASKEDFITIVNEKLSTLAQEYALFPDYEEGVQNRLGGDENLYEDFFFTDTGLCFFFSPYEIAPYTSGIITVEIPYAELTGLIYDGYFPAERERVVGSMHTGSFMETDMEQFTSMAEVTLVAGEDIFVVYPQGNVEDIRITIPGDDKNMPEYTVFAAYEMSEKNAVVISVPQEDAEAIRISYLSNEKLETIPLA